MSRWFVEHDGSSRAAAELDPWLRLRPEDLGPVRVRHRIGTDMGLLLRSGLLFCALPALVAGLILGSVVTIATTTSDDVDGSTSVLAGLVTLGVVLACGVVVLTIYVVVIRASARSATLSIHSHGLAIGAGKPRAIPFGVMDPGRTRWITTPWGGRHVVTSSRRRMTFGSDGILLCGTDGPAPAEQAEHHATIYNASPRAPRVVTPFVWWYLGPEDPAAFLVDLEHAMVADGYPVHGFAQWVSERRKALPFRRARGETFPRRVPGDPVCWRPLG